MPLCWARKHAATSQVALNDGKVESRYLPGIWV